jgi:hypothetical protein
MKTEKILWGIAMTCAVILLLAPTTPRTSWVYPGGMATHSAGWDWLAPISGVVTIGGLMFARSAHPRAFPVVLGSVLAALAFGISAGASAGHWYSLATGALDLGGSSTTYPAPLVLPFAVIASAGAVCSLALLASRLLEESNTGSA